MADDIDDLLDEVEERFGISNSANSEQNNSTLCDTNAKNLTNSNKSKFTIKLSSNLTASVETTAMGKTKKDKDNHNILSSKPDGPDPDDTSDDDSDDIDDIIDDICSSSSETLSEIVPTVPPHIPVNTARLNKPRQQCYPVYVGGTKHHYGAATATNKLRCNKLRCTRCDFKVTIFDDLKWLPDVDYLFLRNNVPDYTRLKPKLLGSKGSSSYCCQCTCQTFSDLKELQDPTTWVCGKHPIDEPQ